MLNINVICIGKYEFVKDNTEEQFLMDVKALKELIEEI